MKDSIRWNLVGDAVRFLSGHRGSTPFDLPAPEVPETALDDPTPVSNSSAFGSKPSGDLPQRLADLQEFNWD